KTASLDFEMYTSNNRHFADALVPEDRIILASLVDNRGRRFLFDGTKYSEKELIIALCQTITSEDYDCICGHNLLGFDLPYLMQRATLLGVKLIMGRDGSELSSSFKKARNGSGDLVYKVFGRHLIDTLPLLMQWDTTHRELENLQLKHAVFTLGLSNNDRSSFNRSEIPRIWDENPEAIINYGLEDAIDALSLYDFLSPAVFFQTQILPLSYQSCATTGTGSKVDLLMIRAYLRKAHSLPLRGALVTSDGSGGLTEVKSLGWHTDVIKVDVSSLYPSICLSYNIKPRTDHLNAFLEILGELTKQRLSAKGQLRARPKNSLEYKSIDSLQNSFKVLINSFYGMLNTNGLYFSDGRASQAITTTGQSILLTMVKNVETIGGDVIEIDTDGIFFALPNSSIDHSDLIVNISRELPQGIKVEYDGHFDFMYSYASKNYILIKDEKVIKKGVAFRSRKNFRIQDALINSAIDNIRRGTLAKLSTYYHSSRQKILCGDVDIDDIISYMSVVLPWDEYDQQNTGKNINKVLELVATRADRKRWSVRSKIYYYNSRKAPGVNLALNYDDDLDVNFYLNVLEKTAEKFIYAFPPHVWHKIFVESVTTECVDLRAWHFRPDDSPHIIKEYAIMLKGHQQLELF
ncbi:MAG: DNA polymerase domain-containing protein, partial [bacterium]|nr:DNA polymerase domain-containing protein [bacterium]